MDLGDLIFFIIFIVIVASNIFKQLKKNKKNRDTTTAEAKTGWRKVLEDIINDARRQMEQAGEPAPGKPGRRPLTWEDLIGAEPEEKPVPQTDSKPNATVRRHPRPVSEAPGREADFDELRGKGTEALDSDWERGMVKEKKPSRMMKGPISEPPEAVSLPEAGLSEEDLRNAVIWHEILSPPLGLRN